MDDRMAGVKTASSIVIDFKCGGSRLAVRWSNDDIEILSKDGGKPWISCISSFVKSEILTKVTP
jgi:hypothetical protein